MGHHRDEERYAEHREAYERVQDAPHEAHLSHELIAGAAAYEAAKAWEEHKAKNGDPSDHAKAKEIMAGAAGALITRLFETKGMDYIDKTRAKHEATKYAQEHHGID